MTNVEIQFLQEIRDVSCGLKRVRFPDLCVAFGRVFPALTGIDQRRRMHELLNTLRGLGEVTFPAGRKHFDHVAEPSLPHWIQLAPVATSFSRPGFDSATFPWVPELRFAAKLRNSLQLDILQRVHDFLATGGASRCLVPIKERSVELFGDEKKLDVVRKSVLFRTERLSLDLLRCYQVTPPLVWERGPEMTDAPVFVVENHSTYDSFVRWNKAHGAWAAVCYGNGDSFEASAPSLRNIVGSVRWNGKLLYFGDLDTKGLIIPLRASKALAEFGLPPLLPHLGCYGRLLERARDVNLPKVSESIPFPSESDLWLGNPLACRIQEWFEQGIRIPQELVGYEQLIEADQKFSVSV